MRGRSPTRARFVLAATLLVGCGDRTAAVDPDGHDRRDDSAVAKVSLREVVGAAFGVPARDAATPLAAYLSQTDAGRSLLQVFPRTASGELDLDRAPLAASSLSAQIGPGSRQRCGEVTIVFRGANAPALRARLPVPATTPACRGIARESFVVGGEAVPLLRAALAEARVPVPTD